MTVLVRSERHGDGERVSYCGGNSAPFRGNHRHRSEGAARCSGILVVHPGLREPTHLTLRVCLRCARRPESQDRRLRLIRVSAGHVHDQYIRIRLDPGRGGHASALLAEFAVVEIEPCGVVLCMREGREAGNYDLAGGQAIGHGVGSIELRNEAVRRPDGNAEPAVAERHGLIRFEIWFGQNYVGAADDCGDVDMESALAPGGGLRCCGCRNGRAERNGANDLEGQILHSGPQFFNCGFGGIVTAACQSSSRRGREKAKNPRNTTMHTPDMAANAWLVEMWRDNSPASSAPTGGRPKKQVP